MSASRARSSTPATSPEGIACLRSAWAYCSLSYVVRLMVRWSAKRSGACGLTFDSGAREGVGEQLLGVGHGLVLRRLQELTRIFASQVGGQQANSTEMQATFGQRVEDDRELPCGARRLNAFVRGILGQAQLVHAI